MRILVVDDAPVMRAMFRDFAQRLAHDVVGEVDDAGEALAQYVELRPDLVVVDGRLPPAGPLELIAHLAERGAQVLVIASLDEVALLRAAVAAGARGGIARPLASSQIEQAFGRLARTS